MSNRKQKKKDWRAFEILISSLERYLKPKGYEFKTPDHLFDYDINDTREVDCSIRYKDADVEKVISVECRKRKGKQDVTWIEQLACKKVSLRLDQTIAVSSTGFSQAAYLKARAHGIILNTYREKNFKKSDPDPVEGLIINKVKVTYTDIETEYQIPDEWPLTQSNLLSMQEAVNRSGGDTIILLDKEKCAGLTLQQIADNCIEKIQNFNFEEKKFRFSYTFPANRYSIPQLPADAYLEKFNIKMKLVLKSERLGDFSIGKYESQDETLIEVSKGTFEASNKSKFNIEIHYKSE